jgi:hypothetical protein
MKASISKKIGIPNLLRQHAQIHPLGWILWDVHQSWCFDNSSPLSLTNSEIVAKMRVTLNQQIAISVNLTVSLQKFARPSRSQRKS